MSFVSFVFEESALNNLLFINIFTSASALPAIRVGSKHDIPILSCFIVINPFLSTSSTANIRYFPSFKADIVKLPLVPTVVL